MSPAPPTVVIVGRPNVGKSTLFNRITGQRRAIVGDEPGITRDRIYGSAEYQDRRFELIDTGGILVHDQEFIPSQVLRQARVALDSAAHIIFLVDGRAEITASDRDLSQMLLRLGKPVTLAVNKAETTQSRLSMPATMARPPITSSETYGKSPLACNRAKGFQK